MFCRFQKIVKPNVRTFMSLDRIPICALTGERRNICDCSCLDSCKGPPAIMACIEAGMIETIAYNYKQLQEEKLANQIGEYHCSEEKKIEIFITEKKDFQK